MPSRKIKIGWIILVLSFLSLNTFVLSQETFSKLYRLGNHNLIFVGLIPTDTGYYVHGVARKIDSHLLLGTFFGFIDLEGELIFDSYVNDSV